MVDSPGQKGGTSDGGLRLNLNTSFSPSSASGRGDYLICKTLSGICGVFVRGVELFCREIKVVRGFTGSPGTSRSKS